MKQLNLESANPYPSTSTSKPATDNGTADGSDTPSAIHDAVILTTLPQWNQVSNEHLRDSHDTTTSQALDASADKQLADIPTDAGDNSSDEEKGDGEEKQRAATKDIGERNEGWLKDCEVLL